MTKQPIRGAVRPLKQWRASLCAVAALMALSAPVAQAADAFGGKAKEEPNKELNERLGRLEQQLTDLAAKQAAAQTPAAGPGPGGLNLPAPPGSPPEPPVADEDLKLDYEVKGELNGKVLVKKGTRVLVMERGEFERFAAQAKTKARAALVSAPALGGAVTPPPANALGMVPGSPPPPPVAAPAPAPAAQPTVSETTRRNGKVVDQTLNHATPAAPATPATAAPAKK